MKNFTKKFMAVALVGAALAGFSATGAQAKDWNNGKHNDQRYGFEKHVTKKVVYNDHRHDHRHGNAYGHNYRPHQPKYVYKRPYYQRYSNITLGFNF